MLLLYHFNYILSKIWLDFDLRATDTLEDMKRIIFSVGRPDFGASAIERIHRRGYQAGIFVDKNFADKARLDEFDVVVPLDFAKLGTEFVNIERYRDDVAGLLCTYENYLLAKAKLGEFFGVPALSVEAAKRSTDKLLMRAAFLDNDPTITPTFQEITNIDEALEFTNTYGFPVITKPVSLVKSLFVNRANNQTALTKNVDETLGSIADFYASQQIYERTPRVLIEQYMKGGQYSVAAYVDVAGKIHFCPGITKLTTATDRGANDSYLYKRELPAELSPADEAALFAVAKKGIVALGLTSSPAHVELMRTPEGVKIIEIGARTGGYRPRMYEIGYGIDLIEAEIALALGETPQLNGRQQTHVAVFELFPKKVGQFREISGLSDAIKNGCYYISIKPKNGAMIGPAKNGFRAAAVIIIEDPDDKRFRQKVAAIDNLTVEVD